MDDDIGKADDKHGTTKTKARGRVLVLDSAASWVVCGGNFVILCLNAVFGRTLSMCFLEFVQKFDASIASTSLSLTFYLLTLSFSSILGTSVLIPMGGLRLVAVIGCVLSAVCTMCVGSAPNIAIFVMCMAFKGASVGISLVPVISLISQYFDKRRSMATALANCGLSAGSIGAPPLIRLLLESYGLRGTFLIIGAIELHAVAAALLMRPRSHYSIVIGSTDSADKGQCSFSTNETSRIATDQALIQNEVLQEDTCLRSVPMSPSSSVLESSQNSPQRKACAPLLLTGAEELDPLSPWVCNENISSSLEREHFMPTVNYHAGCNGVRFAPRKRSVSESGAERPKRQRPLLHPRIDMIASQVGYHGYIKDRINRGSDSSDPRSSIVSVHPVDKDSQQLEDRDSGLDVDTEDNPHRPDQKLRFCEERLGNNMVTSRLSVNNRGRWRSPLSGRHIPIIRTASRQHLNVGEFHLSSWSIVSSDLRVDVAVCALEEEKRRHEEDDQGEDAIELTDVTTAEKGVPVARVNVTSRCFVAFGRAFNLSILRLWTVRLLLVMSLTGNLTSYLHTYLPTMAAKRGVTFDQASLLLTLIGAVDLASRIFLGFFSDLHILTPSQIVVISQITLGTVCHLVYFYTTFDLLVFLSVAIGLMASTCQNLITLVILELVGPGRFLNVFGGLAMMGTLSLALHHPLLNCLLDSSGSFSAPFHYLGMALYINAGCLMLAPWLKARDQRNQSAVQ